jgi:hypothetical protein
MGSKSTCEMGWGGTFMTRPNHLGKSYLIRSRFISVISVNVFDFASVGIGAVSVMSERRAPIASGGKIADSLIMNHTLIAGEYFIQIPVQKAERYGKGEGVVRALGRFRWCRRDPSERRETGRLSSLFDLKNLATHICTRPQ